MTLRPEFSVIPSEFNEFLFAPVGEERNGLELTVLSALTRLGFDPWAEAARLSDLPMEAAVRALAAAIAVLPEGDWKVSDSWAIAARLVNRLPRRSAPAVQSPQRESSSRDEKTKSETTKWLVWVVLAATLFFAMSHLYDNHAPEPAPSAVSSMLR